jgi:hypothetical protein
LVFQEERMPILGEKEEEAPKKAGPTLPLWRRICFSLGGLPYQTTTNVIGFYISVFLLEVAEVLNEVKLHHFFFPLY